MKHEGKIREIAGSLLWMGVAALIIGQFSRDLIFYLDKEVVVVKTLADIEKLRDNMIAEISLPLDFDQAHGVSYLSQREFLLIPFSGLGHRLMYVIEGPVTDKTTASLRPPYQGRVVEKDFTDSWDVHGQSMELGKIFARDRIALPAGAMLIYEAPKEPPGAWQSFISAVAAIYLFYKTYGFSRLLRPGKKTLGLAASVVAP